MEKSQGLAIGAVLAAALFLRPSGSPPAADVHSSETGAPPTEHAYQVPHRGPWIASCNYWAAARRAAEQSTVSTPNAHATLDLRSDRLDIHARLTDADKEEQACDSDSLLRWGIPDDHDPIQISALIATVSDPVHTHLALTFDRTITALLDAANDNDYVSTYHWLPWKNQVGAMRLAESSSDSEPGHDPEREREPGLIILRTATPQPATEPKSLVYLFLVAETPSRGVDGFQFQRALTYEQQLRSAFKTNYTLSTGAKDTIAIIGPSYSGSVFSLRAAIDAAQSNPDLLPNASFDLTGVTSTLLAIDLLNSTQPKIEFRSMGENDALASKVLKDHLSDGRAAFLLEGDTTLAGAINGSINNANKSHKDKDAKETQEATIQAIRFPREISLLRNAQVTQPGASPAGTEFSPYLHFSLKDFSAQDSMPQFSRDSTPLSQEAQLMSIAREIRKFDFDYIALNASNPLDEIFLAQFLHRACPDSRLIFFNADLLMMREIDNVPFIGSITVTPYPLVGLRSAGRAFTDSDSEGYYNASSMVFNKHVAPMKDRPPVLQGYKNLVEKSNQPSLWATAAGKDGYYPLSILRPAASDNQYFLPPQPSLRNADDSKPVIWASRMWDILTTLISLLCIAHVLTLLRADYWSAFSRDLALPHNDQPRRRAAYINITTAFLGCMAFVVSFPLLTLGGFPAVRLGTLDICLSIFVLASGLVAVLVSISKSWDYLRPSVVGASRYDRFRHNIFSFLNLGALLTLLGVPALWVFLCTTSPHANPNLIGLCFAYRSIHPQSGVSPLVPVLLLLFSWYLWGILQTHRLRFSKSGRPSLPLALNNEDDRYFVSETSLEQCGAPRDGCLFRNITCLLITRDLFRRRVGKITPAGRVNRPAIDLMLAFVYGSALVGLSVFTPLQSLDHFVWRTRGISCPYEILVGLLFFPLIGISIAGWLRMVLIWGALRRDLLDRLENMPLRFAFNRLKVKGWMTMLQIGGLQEQWRDISRELESMRQLLHRNDLRKNLSEADWHLLEDAREQVQNDVGILGARYRNPVTEAPEGMRDCDLMANVESSLANFGQKLLTVILIPYWKNRRIGIVERPEIDAKEPQPHDDPWIPAVEEFLAIRYLSLIRSILTNLRYLMIFVTAAFVLAIWAWNSYPFQPSQLGDLLFTGLLLVLGSGVVWVFAQMHRNPILSRITETRPNELGWDFYFRIAAYGALPVLTWLAYQFPDIANVISKFLEPGVPVMK